MKVIYYPWKLAYNIFNNKGYIRSCSKEKEYVCVCSDEGIRENYYIERPIYPYLSKDSSSAELLMFKIDLWLIESGFEVREPFKFPLET